MVIAVVTTAGEDPDAITGEFVPVDAVPNFRSLANRSCEGRFRHSTHVQKPLTIVENTPTHWW